MIMIISYHLTNNNDHYNTEIEINNLNLFIQEHYETLEYLDCSSNNLTELPELPPNLKFLHCNNNNLTELPELPLTLEGLYCYNNNLIDLPIIPLTLKILHCHNNHLIYYDFTILHYIDFLVIHDQIPKPLILPPIII